MTGVEFDDYPGNTGMSTCTVTASDYLQASGRTVGNYTVALSAAKALAQIDTLYSTFGNTNIVRNGGSADADAYNYNGTLLQRFQQSLVDSMNNCAAKESDAGWRIVRRKSAGDVSAAFKRVIVLLGFTFINLSVTLFVKVNTRQVLVAQTELVIAA